MNENDKIFGIIFGQCIGDALGLSTEFLSKEQVAKYYKNKEFKYDNMVQDGHRSRWVTGDWTDDSDQMILILRDIIENNGTPSSNTFASKLYDWYYHGFPELGDEAGMDIGNCTRWVIHEDCFKKNPHKASKDVWELSDRYMAPNGGVMRTSVIGCLDKPLEELIDITIDICRTTHYDERCAASCVFIVVLIRNLRLKYDIVRALSNAQNETIRRFPTVENELKKWCNISSLEELELNKHIGYTFKPLGCAVFCLKYILFTKNITFYELLDKIIREGGDADTNAAVVGAVLGAYYGFTGLPKGLVKDLAYKDFLQKEILKLLGK
jgi:ADP-ribosylglycohydrolase